MMDAQAPTLPLHLVIAGRRCLVAGTGEHALRRVDGLVEAGARVDWLMPPDAESPALDPEVRVLRSPFPFVAEASPADLPEPLDHYRLVFGYHGDADANRRLREACRDSSAWFGGLLGKTEKVPGKAAVRPPLPDFVTPATFHWGKSVVSLGSGLAGADSCRRSKAQSRVLRSLVEADSDRVLTVIGVDHRHIDLDRLAPVHPSEQKQAALRWRLGMIPAGVAEFALLVTCNRVELYGVVKDDPALTEWIIEILGLMPVRDRVYVLRGAEALLHATDLVCGHHSAVPGETQITHQFKRTVQEALDRGEAGVGLQKLVDTVLLAGKRVRQAQPGVLVQRSIPAVVADWIEEAHAMEPHRRHVLIAGAGEIGRDAAGEIVGLCRDRGVPLGVTWTTRRAEKLEELRRQGWGFAGSGREPGFESAARPIDGMWEPLAWESALADLSRFDFVVTAVAAPEPVIRQSPFEGGPQPDSAAARRLTLFDLGMPPNVDERLKDAPGVELVRLENLKRRQAEKVGDRGPLYALSRKHLGDLGELSEQAARIVR